MSHIWLRHEYKPDERRAPITPAQVGLLITSGHTVTVESSTSRVFEDRDYAKQGAEIVSPGTWHLAPKMAFILGIKERLQDEIHAENLALQHRHIYFAHVFKGQKCTPETMRRFTVGRGTLLDLEYLVDDTGMRVAAFSYSAGYAGAIAAVYIWAEKAAGKAPPYTLPKHYLSRSEFLALIQAKLKTGDRIPRALVIGARGRAGQGAVALFDALEIEAVKWGKAETQAGGPFPEILAYDILCNCVFLEKPVGPFLTAKMVAGQSKNRLSVVADVSNDLSFNPIFGIAVSTTFDDAAIRVENVDVIEIENLPALTPLDSSIEYATQLFPHLLTLLEGNVQRNSIWERAALTYFTHHDIPQLAIECGRDLAELYLSEPKDFTVENIREYVSDIFAKNPLSRTERLYFVDYLMVGAMEVLPFAEEKVFSALLLNAELDEIYDSSRMRLHHALLEAVYSFSRSEDFACVKEVHASDKFFELCDCLALMIDLQPGAEEKFAEARLLLAKKLGHRFEHAALKKFFEKIDLSLASLLRPE